MQAEVHQITRTCGGGSTTTTTTSTTTLVVVVVVVVVVVLGLQGLLQLPLLRQLQQV